MPGMQYLGEVRLMSFGFAPRGDWQPCDGRLMPIRGNEDLFKLLRTTYGGDGQTTFGLPDLRGAAAVHRGTYQQGERGGVPSVTLGWAETAGPGHNHVVQASADDADSALAADNVLAKTNVNMYAPFDATKAVTLPAPTVQQVGGEPHENMAPYQAVMFCIATQGIWPIPT